MADSGVKHAVHGLEGGPVLSDNPGDGTSLASKRNSFFQSNSKRPHVKALITMYRTFKLDQTRCIS